MSKQKVLENIVEVTIAKSNTWTCHKCGERIHIGEAFLHQRRCRHVFLMCGKCVVFAAMKVTEIDPTVQSQCVPELL